MYNYWYYPGLGKDLRRIFFVYPIKASQYLYKNDPIVLVLIILFLIFYFIRREMRLYKKGYQLGFKTRQNKESKRKRTLLLSLSISYIVGYYKGRHTDKSQD